MFLMQDYQTNFIFEDKEGNHILVALNLADDLYKEHLNIDPDDFAVPCIDISLEKEFPERPLHGVIFRKIASFLLHKFQENQPAIFYYIISVQELPENHRNLSAHDYRAHLFERLEQYLRQTGKWPARLLAEQYILNNGGFSQKIKIFYFPEQSFMVRSFLNSIDPQK